MLIFFIAGRSHCETLEEIVNIAKKNNPDIKRIEKELSVLKQRYKAAGRLPNPGVSLNLRDEGSITIFQYIPWYDKILLQKQIEEKRYQIQQFVYIQEKNRIIRQIIENCFLVWFYREKIKINRQHIDIIENLSGIKGLKLEDESKLKILKTSLELENQDSELIVSKLVSDLKMLVNYNFEEIDVEIKDIPDLDEEKIREKIKSSALLARQIEKQIERDNLSYKLAKEIFMPDFGLSVTYKSRDRFQEAFSFSVNFYLNVPIWRRLNQEQIVLEQKLQAIAAQERKINVTNQVLWSGEKILAEYRTSLKNLQKLKQMNDVYKSDLEATVKNFIDGKDSINSLIFSIQENIKYLNKVNHEILSVNLSYFRLIEMTDEL